MRATRFRYGVTSAAILTFGSYFFSGANTGPARAQTSVSTISGVDTSAAALVSTTTPIKHVVVLYQENVSFDHYFATYPNAANPANEPAFSASPNTPSVNGLSGPLLTHNPNSVQPFRLDRTQALTCDQNHDYTAEQKAFDNGLMDKFVEFTEGKAFNSAQYCPNGATMGYFDGNTVTAMWNYAQSYAMSDNSYNTVFGPSTPGALALTAGDTAGTTCGPSSAVYGVSPCPAGSPVPAASGGSGAVYSDADPYYDDCSKGGPTDKSKTIAQTGKNAGDLLNAKGITWGWFQGGFDDCTAKHVDSTYDQSVGINPATDPNTTGDYNPHHQPFQYFAQTSNPHHLRPSSIAAIGHTDQANHQYDMNDFWAAADAGNMFDFKQAVANGHSLTLDPTTGAAVAASPPGRSSPYFLVSFSSKNPGQGTVNFGPSCSGLVETATMDSGRGSTAHTVTVIGNELSGTVGDIGITPGATYYYQTVTTTTTASGKEVDNNNGRCYQVTVPAV